MVGEQLLERFGFIIDRVSPQFFTGRYAWPSMGRLESIIVAMSPLDASQLAITATTIVPQVVSRMLAIGYAGV